VYLILSEETTQPVDYPAGSLGMLDDVLQDLRYLPEVH
jgi:hypothetical protein